MASPARLRSSISARSVSTSACRSAWRSCSCRSRNSRRIASRRSVSALALAVSSRIALAAASMLSVPATDRTTSATLPATSPAGDRRTARPGPEPGCRRGRSRGSAAASPGSSTEDQPSPALKRKKYLDLGAKCKENISILAWSSTAAQPTAPAAARRAGRRSLPARQAGGPLRPGVQRPPAVAMRLQQPGGRHGDLAAQPVGRPVEGHLAAQLPLDRRGDDAGAEAESAPAAPGNRRAADLHPVQPQPGGAARLARRQVPADPQQPARDRQRAVLRRIGRQLMHHHGNGLHRLRPRRSGGPSSRQRSGHLRPAADPRGIGGEFLAQQFDKIGAVPAAAGQQLVRPGQRRRPAPRPPAAKARGLSARVSRRIGLHHRERHSWRGGPTSRASRICRSATLPLLGHVADHADRPAGRRAMHREDGGGGCGAPCRRRAASRYSISKPGGRRDSAACSAARSSGCTTARGGVDGSRSMRPAEDPLRSRAGEDHAVAARARR